MDKKIYFSEVVDKAIADIYYCYDNRRAAAAIKPLFEAANSGDGDASYILSRCLSGPQYSWQYHPYEADDDKADFYVRQSILQGSAAGVLGAMRCGMLTPEMEEAMHFDNLQQAWDVIYEKAEAGSLFCQNMIGNTYFWMDVWRIQGKHADCFANPKACDQYLRENTLACIPWFERAFRGGMGFAGRNLYNLYNNGDKDFQIEPQPNKAREIEKLGAELGYPDWMESYGRTLLKEKGHEAEGVEYCKKAAEMGQLSSWFNVGKAYQLGEVCPKDIPYAMTCYEKGLADPEEVGCANRAGELYFLGQNGIPQDYARAVSLFERAHALDNKWGNDMLGLCYLLGQGCKKDYARAKQLFEEADYSSDILNYGLGLIYADGLGVPENIKKGVEYFKKAPDYKPAQEALIRFKKNWFGRWVRR